MRIHANQCQVENEKVVRRHLGFPGVDEARCDSQRGEGLDEGADDFHGFSPAHDECQHALRSGVELLFLVVFPRVRLDHANSGETLLHGDHEKAGLFFLLATGFAHLVAHENHGNQAEREEHECREGEPWILGQEEGHDRNQRNRMFDQVTGKIRAGGLRHPSLIEHRLNEFARFLLVEETERLVDEPVKKFGAQVKEYPVADPDHAVLVQVSQ